MASGYDKNTMLLCYATILGCYHEPAYLKEKLVVFLDYKHEEVR